MDNKDVALYCSNLPIPERIGDKNLIEFCKSKYNPEVNFNPNSTPLSTITNQTIPGNTSKNNFSANPNPFDNWLTLNIELPWKPQPIELLLTNALGRVVWKDHFFYEGPVQYQLDKGLSALPAGIYHAQVQGNQYVKSLTLIKP